MSDKGDLEPLQRLLLWTLAVYPEGEFWKNIKTSLTPAKRDALIRDGLIEKDSRKDPQTNGRPIMYLVLSDRGWTWCQNHLRDEIKTRSPQPAVILERLLGLLADYFDAPNDTNSLGQLVLEATSARREAAAATANASENGSPETNGHAKSERMPVDQAIRDACLQLAQGQRNVRLRLADLRAKLAVERPLLDEELLKLERHGELALYPLDNPQEITSADREAALRTVTGNERHIVYFGGSS